MEIGLYLEQFQKYLGAEKRYSPNTSIAYERDLWQFFTFLTGHKGEEINTKTLKEIDETDIRAYLTREHMSGSKGKASLNRQLSSIRTFFNWLEKRHDIKVSRIKLVENMKVPAHTPRAISPADTWRLIEDYKKTQTDNLRTRRNHALFIAMYGLGLRISEALSLNREIVNATQITIIGKGNKTRILPLPDFAQQAFADVEELLPPTIEQNSPLFTNPRGHRLKSRTVQKMMTDLRTEMNLPTHLTPHALRHSFASHLLAGGVDLRVVQEMLGHASLATTQRYLDADFARLMKVHSSAHPLNKN